MSIFETIQARGPMRGTRRSIAVGIAILDRDGAFQPRQWSWRILSGRPLLRLNPRELEQVRPTQQWRSFIKSLPHQKKEDVHAAARVRLGPAGGPVRVPSLTNSTPSA